MSLIEQHLAEYSKQKEEIAGQIQTLQTKLVMLDGAIQSLQNLQSIPVAPEEALDELAELGQEIEQGEEN
jgi:conjugal transfer/entry exclusion protein